jgi:nucleotide-binding universal stress UspA family protein
VYKQILVALDGSALAEKGLANALETARQNPGARLILLSILPVSSVGEGISDFNESFVQLQNRINKALENEARQYLKGLVTRYQSEGIPMVSVVGWGDAAGGIINYIGENNVDLIVITTRGRSGLGKLLLGSVAAKIIGLSPVPVLVIPPDRKK